MFGQDRVGFIKQTVDATLAKNEKIKIPGTMVLRGNAVAVLIVLEDDAGVERVVLVDQPRLSVGKFHFLEIPAGMVRE